MLAQNQIGVSYHEFGKELVHISVLIYCPFIASSDRHNLYIILRNKCIRRRLTIFGLHWLLKAYGSFDPEACS